MPFLSKSLIATALGLTLVANVRGDDEKKAGGGDKMQKQAITVRGVISDFTMIGETDVDETTGKATTAEATLITVIGHPSGQHADHAHQAEADKGATKTHGEHHHHRMNLYLAALSPKTKVSEVNAAGQDVALDDKDADFDDLEIGDRVEITFIPKMMDKDAEQKDTDAKEKTDKKTQDDSKVASMKHGRHRAYLGMAMQIRVLPDEETAGDAKKK